MTAEQYRAYWLHQAENHPELQHTEESKVFEMISIEEAFGDFRMGAKEKSFILRPIFYTYRVGINTQDGQSLKQAQGGYIIAHYYDPRGGGSQAMLDALDKAERVNDQLMEKIIADSRAGHPLWNRSLDSNQNFNSQPVLLTSGLCYVGYRTVFNFHNAIPLCYPAEQAEWDDDGLTPHQLV